jgi:nucleotide-binding universal stress UspA family protein
VSKSEDEEVVIRRILVALDASTHSLAALEAAANLAADLGAELIGLFVEDENLLHLAGLPFAHEVRSPLATSERMNSDRMEQDLHLQASQAERALKKAAERVQVKWSFRVVRGQVSESVLAAALEVDLLAMGRVSRPLSKRSRLGSTARAATTETRRSLLLMQKDSGLNQPVLVTYDGSQAAKQALAVAARLARGGDDELNILLLSDTVEDAKPLKVYAEIWLNQHGLKARFHRLSETTVTNLVSMVQAVDNCVLVLGGDNPLLRAEALQDLLDETDCPVMLVR